MDCRTGEIHNIELEQEFMHDRYSENRAALEQAFKDQTNKQMLALTKEEADELEPLPKKVRKNKMRNKPCVCGSGIKFKKCCWGNYV